MSDDGGNRDLVKRVLRDPDGNLQVRRVLDALGGRRSDDRNLVPLLLVGLLATLVGGPLLGYLDYGTAAGAAESLAWGLVAYVLLASTVVSDRLEAYFEDDEDLAAEELRARYARGDLDLDEFTRRLDAVFEDGPGFVFEDDTADPEVDFPPADDADEGGDDALAILRRRFARGDVDEATYRRRVAALRETAAGAATESTAEREGARRED